MVHNLYLILAVAFRTLGLWWVARALVGLIAAAVLGGGLSSAFASLIGLAPTLAGGVLLWFLATRIADLVTKDLE